MSQWLNITGKFLKYCPETKIQHCLLIKPYIKNANKEANAQDEKHKKKKCNAPDEKPKIEVLKPSHPEINFGNILSEESVDEMLHCAMKNSSYTLV